MKTANIVNMAILVGAFTSVIACSASSEDAPSLDESGSGGDEKLAITSGIAKALTPPSIGRVVPMRTSSRATSAPSGVASECSTSGALPKLSSHDNRVLSAAVVVPVLWNTSVDSTLSSSLETFYRTLANTPFLKQMNTEYGSGIATVTSRYTLQPQTTKTTLNADDIAAEIERGITAGKLPKETANEQTLYMVHFPPGITLQSSEGSSCSGTKGFCGYHSSSSFTGPNRTSRRYAWAALPDLSGAGCACNWTGRGSFADTTHVSAHELEEALTNPYSTSQGWWDGNTGCEIGDICAIDSQIAKLGTSDHYSVQPWWSSASGACVRTASAATCGSVIFNGDFETPDGSGWFTTAGAGIDKGKGLAYRGANNGWVRGSQGWNAINQWLPVVPNTTYRVSAKIRSSATLKSGQAFMSIRGVANNVLNEVPIYKTACDYQTWTFTFNSGTNDSVLFYSGLWGNGTDAWMQIDNVDIQPAGCVEPIGSSCAG